MCWQCGQEPEPLQVWEEACAIEVYPSDQKFALTPYPGELRAAMDRTLAALQTEFRAHHPGMPPIYLGEPIVDRKLIPINN